MARREDNVSTKIEITKDYSDVGVLRFRAKVHVRPDIGVRTGASSGSGPWVDGFGATPEAAVVSLYENIGRYYVTSLDLLDE